MPTPHINANLNDFAKTVLMPGDPLRAKFIAESFLDGAKEITNVRGMLGYTGFYEGRPVSVMGSGMGMPSMGIYSYELFNVYGVDTIIRIGSCGGYSGKVKLRDVIFAQAACTNSNFAAQYGLNGSFAPVADYGLLARANEIAEELGIYAHTGNILSSDVFYAANDDWEKWASLGVLAVEMEAAALYMNAAYAGKKALCILTVSDHFLHSGQTTSEEREKTFTDMIKIALGFAG